MKIIDLDEKEVDNPSSDMSIALGNFDGLHIGHRALIHRSVSEAGRIGGLSGVLLFKNHTSDYVSRERGHLLMRLDDKIRLLEELHIDVVFLITFDAAFMSIPKGRFVSHFLVETLHAKNVIVGEDYRFGFHASGDVPFLQEQGKHFDFSVCAVPDVTYGGERISSTRIRQCLLSGALPAANEMLGASYAMRGRIVSGAGRGRHLGFSTANLALDFPYCIPKNGVYLTRSCLGRERRGPYYGMTNIGTNPTFTDSPDIKIETHLFDFSENLYKQEIRIEFLRYERGDIKFHDRAELIARLREDERVLRGWIEEMRPDPNTATKR